MMINQTKNTEVSANSSLLRNNDNGNQRYAKRQPNNRKSYQTIWKNICIAVGIMSTIITYKVYLYQTSQNLAQVRKGHIAEFALYSIPFCIIFMLGEMIMHKLIDKRCQDGFIDHAKFSDSDKRKKRCFLIVKWSWNVLYYIFTIVFGFITLHNTPIIPTWLGGNGQCTTVSPYINQFPQATILMKTLYLIHFGRHLAKLIQHCFLTPEGNYYQFTLHHSLSTFLIFFSYLMNMWLMGLFVLLMHDFSDVFLIVARIGRDTQRINKIFLLMIDCIGGVAWILCRIILLSHCAIYSGLYTIHQLINYPEKFNSEIAQLIFLPLVFMTLMTSALQIVQLFWTYYIISAFIGSNVSDKVAKNSYD